MSKISLFTMWQQEFKNYSARLFQRDLAAGLTVAAVALPLALAFGVAGGATPAAGLITAIIAGLVIGALSGAPYQISGPTGAMSAVLIVVAQKHGMPGVWLAALMAGIIILALGLLKLGRIINFIPTPVITGFTSGIALIILVGQLDNFLGIKTPGQESSALKLAGYFTGNLPAFNWQSIAVGMAVIAAMLIMPRPGMFSRWPAALAGIAIVTAWTWAFNWNVASVGKIPASLILDERFEFNFNQLGAVNDLLGAAGAIAALGSIESLLAGVVAGRMTGIRLNANQELVAQGVGNIILPFFGGVPATAAIARISVGVKAGGSTRLVSIIHSLTLLVSALFLGEFIARIPLAALAGVLIVTAHRMNEWHLIRHYFSKRLKGPTTIMLVTMLATFSLDLTQAIVIGIILSLLLFISQTSRLDIIPTQVDWKRFRQSGFDISDEHAGIWVIYVSGALYFGTAGQFSQQLEQENENQALILSMRGVSLIDVSGLQVLENLWKEQSKKGRLFYITGLQPQVRRMFERVGLVEEIGPERFCWSADQAIIEACRTLTQRGAACEVRAGVYLQQAEAGAALAALQTDMNIDPELTEMPLGITTLD